MRKKFFLVLGIFLLLAACATYQSKVAGARNSLKTGQFKEAQEKLKPLAEKQSDDQLVYLLDYATALQIGGQYKESIQAFLKADKLADFQDYFSVTKTAAATLGSEEMVQYKGESYEKILINAYLAINYLMLNEFDDALVEVRRVNDKISKIRQEGRKDYELNPFAHYLGGLIWESDGKFDDAYISYNEAYKLDATNPYLPEDLLRAAKKSRRMDEYQKWKSEFPDVVENPDGYDKKKGELVVLIQQGWGPEKNFQRGNQHYASLYPVYSVTTGTQLHVEGVGDFHSKMVYNLEKVVIKTFDDDKAWSIARKVGSTVAKAIVADQVRQKTNQFWGDLTEIFLIASDRADLRQWSTLPKDFQIARVWLPAGDYEFSLQGVSGNGMPTADRQDPVKFSIHAGHKTFSSWRTLR